MATGCWSTPPYSPDLNCIEHAWAELRRRLSLVEPRPRNIDELWEAAQQVWDEIPASFFKKLVRSMRDRWVAVKKAKGGATRY